MEGVGVGVSILCQHGFPISTFLRDPVPLAGGILYPELLGSISIVSIFHFLLCSSYQ